MRICVVIGTRPQFIKASVLIPALNKENIETSVINTGQHYDMELSKNLFSDLDIKQFDADLQIGSGVWRHQIGSGIRQLDKLIHNQNYHALLVIGDSNPAVVGALSGLLNQIPVIHCEAGLRNFDARMPEELNRRIVDRVATYHFCSSRFHAQNILNENRHAAPAVVGDLLVDVFAKYSRVHTRPKQIKSNLEDGCVLLTLHRRENMAQPERIKNFVIELLTLTHRPVVWPVHPRARVLASNILAAAKSISYKLILTSPLTYTELNWVKNKSILVITDSIGLQVEAYLLRLPSVSLRFSLEHPFLEDHGVTHRISMFDDSKSKLALILRDLENCSWSNVPHDLFGTPGVSGRIAAAVSTSVVPATLSDTAVNLSKSLLMLG